MCCVPTSPSRATGTGTAEKGQAKMVQAPLPPEYSQLSDEETHERIRRAKQALGERVVVLGHHYQRDEIIQHADYRGDSYKLARDATRHPETEFIVFCGVHFMAETADILTPDYQKVILPNMSAGCSMADMANIYQVRACWRDLTALLPAESLVPVTYMNSAANLKAFCGERGGIVCTSSNAQSILEWAFRQGEKVLFFPDQHLGRNTGIKMDIDPHSEMVVWDPDLPLGGNTEEALRRAKLILWKGHCSVHMRFTLAQIQAARKMYPGIKVVVHPECRREVVEAADCDGSTEYIVKVIRESPPGSQWAVGTEINLVHRLAAEHPDKFIMCLDPIVCPCSTMYRIHPSYLCWAMENLAQGNVVNQVKVPESIAHWARVALDRMIEVTEAAKQAAGSAAAR
ncbi:MAG: quinolinate synthase NadA [Armatimonadota bacterium]